MRVALVSTWGSACGIAEHAAYLKESVEQADPTVQIVPVIDLHPDAIRRQETPSTKPPYDLIVLNYQAALLSQWTPTAIEEVRERYRVPIVVIYHDTGVPNSEQCKGIVTAADATIIHEPAADLLGCVEYWRMGVPGWRAPGIFDRSETSWNQGRPILGTVGFPFPWKNYDELARVTRANGWAFYLIAPEATAADGMRWEAINPWIVVNRGFMPRRLVVEWLGACDATAFCYTCANTGQSGAVLQGIAARKPVIAFSSCRQFRALYADPLGQEAIDWVTTFDAVGDRLRHVPIQRCDPGIVALAEQDSWAGLGRKYAALFCELVS